MIRAAICALLVLSITAIDVKNNAWTLKDQQVLASIKTSNWASFIINYAEVHLENSGVLQELVQGINDLIEDLNAELNKAHQDFSRRTNNHNRDVTQLTADIEDAERDLFNGHDFIDNVLIPTRARYQNQLDQLRSNIAENRRNLNEETQVRKNQNEEFLAKAAEHNEAISAIDECLQLLSTITNPSLVQIKRIQQNIARIQKTLTKHSFYAPLIRALLEITNGQNFSDQGALQQIVVAFNNLRNELVASLNDETAEEAVRVADFEARVVQLNAELSDFNRQVLIKTAELTTTEEKLQKTIEYVAQRTVDRDTFVSQLNTENDNYAQETEIYQNLVAQYQKELTASQQALELISQPRFVEYVNAKLRS